MVFNFYFNKDGEPNRNKDIEDIMKKMEIHFADWNDFYQFYMKHAKPPNKNTDKIQDLFNDLREDFIKIIEQYNTKVHQFAEIKEMDTDDFESQVINQMKDMIKPKDTKDKDSDSNLNMHN